MTASGTSRHRSVAERGHYRSIADVGVRRTNRRPTRARPTKLKGKTTSPLRTTPWMPAARWNGLPPNDEMLSGAKTSRPASCRLSISH